VTGLRVEPATGNQSGASLLIRWEDANSGTLPALRAWSDQVILRNTSTGETLFAGSIAYDPAAAGNAPLAPAASLPRQLALTLPDGPRGVGTIEIQVTTDLTDQVFESNPDDTAESNNSAAASFESTLAPYPDVQVRNLTLDPDSGLQSGAAVTVRWQTTNAGNRAAAGLFYDRLVIRNTGTNETLSVVTLSDDAPLAPGA